MERALSGDQGPSLGRHGNVLGDSDERRHSPSRARLCPSTMSLGGRGHCGGDWSSASRKHKQPRFWRYFCYKTLNLVINYLDFVILGLDLLICGSDKCTM